MELPVADAIDRALERASALVRSDPALSAELEASVPDFFGGPPPSGGPGEVLRGALRHLEWFVLERHSPHLFGVPAERLLQRLLDGAAGGRAGGDDDPDRAAAVQSLLDSFAGLFEVVEVRPGEGLWVRDVSGFGHFAVLEPEGSHVLRAGDVLVGRLYPIGGGLHRASRAAGYFHDDALASALQADLERLRAQTGRNVLHLSQRELEHMLWAAGRRPEPAEPELELDPLPAAREVLARGSVDPTRAESILAELAAAPPPDSHLMPGAGDRLGEILDELAFDTSVDLDAARRALTLVWAHPPAAPDAAPRRRRAPGGNGAGDSEADRRAAVDAFARGRAEGGDLDQLLSALERDLHLDEEGDGPEDPWAAAPRDGDEEETPIPDFPGVVGALVTEFLWELGREQGQERAQRFVSLLALADYGARLGQVEDLDARELLRFATFWIHERGGLPDERRATALLDGLSAFCEWVEAVYEVPLAREFGPVLSDLRESFPRVAVLNARLGPAPEGAVGELLEVAAEPDGALLVLRDRAGVEHRALAPEVAAELRAGDRLRGLVDEGRVRVFRAYPPESAGLA